MGVMLGVAILTPYKACGVNPGTAAVWLHLTQDFMPVHVTKMPLGPNPQEGGIYKDCHFKPLRFVELVELVTRPQNGRGPTFPFPRVFGTLNSLDASQARWSPSLLLSSVRGSKGEKGPQREAQTPAPSNLGVSPKRTAWSRRRLVLHAPSQSVSPHPQTHEGPTLPPSPAHHLAGCCGSTPWSAWSW